MLFTMSSSEDDKNFASPKASTLWMSTEFRPTSIRTTTQKTSSDVELRGQHDDATDSRVANDRSPIFVAGCDRVTCEILEHPMFCTEDFMLWKRVIRVGSPVCRCASELVALGKEYLGQGSVDESVARRTGARHNSRFLCRTSERCFGRNDGCVATVW